MRSVVAEFCSEVSYISPQAQPIRRIEGHLALSSPRELHDIHDTNILGRVAKAFTTENNRPIKRHAELPRSADNYHLRLRSPPLQPSTRLYTTATMLGLSAMQPRQLAAQVLNFALVLSTAFMLWKGLSVVADSPSPIVVVLSGSMEPAFQRGDLLFLWNRGLDTQVGEIVVYNVKGKDIPIVHRVVRRYGGE
jgi:hypothetical protein